MTDIHLSDEQKRHVISTARKLQQIRIRECFDPAHTDSRPTPKQQQVLDDISTVPSRYVRAGNQCLERGTLVATPQGPVPIEQIRCGDTVYDEHGQPISVKQTFYNGRKEVADVTVRGKTWVSCTGNHVFLTENSSSRSPRQEERKAADLRRDDGIVKVDISCPLGEVYEPHSYVIGAFLGDGCSRGDRKGYLVLSSGTPEVPERVAELLGSSTERSCEGNYNWKIFRTDEEVHHYKDWCSGRYAHEKIADLSVIRSWNRSSLLQFVAGLLDTDGSVSTDKNGGLSLSFDMQATSVIEALEYACLALWQLPMSRGIDDRDKYVNGPCLSLYCRNPVYVKRALKELDPYLVSPQKKYLPEYDDILSKRTRENCISSSWGANPRIAETYDIHVDSPTNLYCLANGLVTHNSGKTQLAAREVAWLFTNTHPTFVRPEKWGNEPLQLIILGKSTRQLEHTIWRKIQGFLPEGTYKPKVIGGALQEVKNLENGNVILFISHNNPTEARKNVQSFVAHYIWIDEMPGTYKLIDECQRRVQANNGPFLLTFTPKDVNLEIQRKIDNLDGKFEREYRFHAFDNPIYTQEDKDRILASISSYSEAYQQAVLEGGWLLGEEMVYLFDYESVVEEPGPHYDRQTWRHTVSIDPALKSKAGLTVWAEDPRTNIWYCVLATYLEGIYDPDELEEEAYRRTSGYFVVRRISDTEPWFVGIASRKRRPYMCIYKKVDRKGELIKNLQGALSSRIRVAPWCEDLIAEFRTCRWAEGSETSKIVSSSSYHLLDSSQYFVDNIPLPEKNRPNLSIAAKLIEADDARRDREATQANVYIGRGARLHRSRRWR